MTNSVMNAHTHKATEAQALQRFSALSQETRLRIVRLLVIAGDEGLPAGSIASQLGSSDSRLSFHLSHLEHAGLVQSRREGRSIIYSVVFPALAALSEFLIHDCCRGFKENDHAGCQPESCD
ncbi:MAG: metalloregulator ArsR/SmtB family transcription factor [Pseudohongiella sp.]|nr:metalloregulator ArsR/SmtB family transcription factor [Pseudohongiella sp.]